MKTRWHYLTRVGVDRADVLHPLVALQDDLLHVDPDLFHALYSKLQIDELQETLDIPQQLLRDALWKGSALITLEVCKYIEYTTLHVL